MYQTFTNAQTALLDRSMRNEPLSNKDNFGTA
jgi:hypothetical protein